MFHVEAKMNELISFVKSHNHIWPFGALICDKSGKTLTIATDCANISPLYHAESLAIHLLATNFKCEDFKELFLVTTAEPDVMSFGSIIWANVTGWPIKKLYYGASLQDAANFWDFGIGITNKELNTKAKPSIQLEGGYMRKECVELMQEAKNRQLEIDESHPGKTHLSQNFQDFCEVNYH